MANRQGGGWGVAEFEVKQIFAANLTVDGKRGKHARALIPLAHISGVAQTQKAL